MPKSGSIGFSSGKGFFSNAIRFFSKSHWSHSFLITHPENTIPSVLEASQLVQKVPYSRYGGVDHEIYEIDSPNISNTLDYIYVTYAGAQYGYLQILWFMWRWLNSLIGRKLTESNWFPNEIICSELVIDYLNALGEPYKSLFEELDPNVVSPQDIYEIVKANPQWFTKL